MSKRIKWLWSQSNETENHWQDFWTQLKCKQQCLELHCKRRACPWGWRHPTWKSRTDSLSLSENLILMAEDTMSGRAWASQSQEISLFDNLQALKKWIHSEEVLERCLRAHLPHCSVLRQRNLVENCKSLIQKQPSGRQDCLLFSVTKTSVADLPGKDLLTNTAEVRQGIS